MNAKVLCTALFCITAAFGQIQFQPVRHFVSVDYPGAAESTANGVNTTGAIAGFYNLTPGPGAANSPTGDRAYLFDNGRFETLTPPGSIWARATAVNDLGVVVGGYSDPQGLVHGFLYSGGVFSTINYPGAMETALSDINSQGRIVGGYLDAASHGHGFVLSLGKFQSVDYPGSIRTTMLGINLSGNISGFYVDANQITHGFLYNAGQFTVINHAGAPSYTACWGINDAGLMTCSYVDVNGKDRGFIYSKGVFTDIDVPGAAATLLNRSNSKGQIVGYYLDSLGEYHAFLASPGP